MAANENSEPPFLCPNLPSFDIQEFISKCNVLTTNSFWLKYYLPQPIRVDSGINVRLPSALSIQNSSDHNQSPTNSSKKPEHKRQPSTAATRQLESLQFELCLAENLANKPIMTSTSNNNTTSTTTTATGSNTGGGGDDYDDPFAGLSFESPRETDASKEPITQASTSDNKGSKDPFAGPFEKGAHICELDNKYRLLLNKFPVWPNNVLVVSKNHIDQTSPLNANEFDLSYKVLLSCIMNNPKESSFTNSMNLDCPHLLFLNSGTSSGGSLTHRHLQIIYNLSHLPYNIIGLYLKTLKFETENKKKTLEALTNPSMQNSNDFDANALLEAMGDEKNENNNNTVNDQKDEKQDDNKVVEAIETAIKDVGLDNLNSASYGIYEENEDGITKFEGFGFVHGIILIDSKKWYEKGYTGKELKDMYDKLIGYVNKEAKRDISGYNLLLNNEMMMVVGRKEDNYQGFRVNALPFAGLFFATSEKEMELFKNGGKCIDALKSVTY